LATTWGQKKNNMEMVQVVVVNIVNSSQLVGNKCEKCCPESTGREALAPGLGLRVPQKGVYFVS